MHAGVGRRRGKRFAEILIAKRFDFPQEAYGLFPAIFAGDSSHRKDGEFPFAIAHARTNHYAKETRFG